MLDGHDTTRVGVSNFLQPHRSSIVISLQLSDLLNSIVQHIDTIMSKCSTTANGTDSHVYMSSDGLNDPR